MQAIVAEFDARETARKAEIAQQEAVIKAHVLLPGATAQGTSLQAIIMAPRITWDNKAMQVYSTLHLEVLAYRKVGEPSVQIRARSLKREERQRRSREGSLRRGLASASSASRTPAKLWWGSPGLASTAA